MRPIRRSLSAAMVALAIGTGMACAQTLPEDPETVAAGAALFQELCAACHGEDATEGAPGDIRGLGRGTIIAALGGVEEMPSFSFLEDDESDALILWLDHARDE
jgi:mono/diheme cytochrome c family protein